MTSINKVDQDLERRYLFKKITDVEQDLIAVLISSTYLVHTYISWKPDSVSLSSANSISLNEFPAAPTGPARRPCPPRRRRPSLEPGKCRGETGAGTRPVRFVGFRLSSTVTRTANYITLTCKDGLS